MIGDTIKFTSNILAGIGPGNNWDTVSSGGNVFNFPAWAMDPVRKNDTLFLNTQAQLVNPYNPNRSDANYFPVSASAPEYQNVTDPSTVDPFFTPVNYRGAFGFGQADWGAGWTNWRPDTVDYNNVPPIGIQQISTTVPSSFSLRQNYPNPFNPQTVIKFTVLSAGIATLKIFNVIGQEVRTLVNNEVVAAGTYKADFNASDLPSGVYFYKLTVNTASQQWSDTKKMVLVK